MIPEIKIQSEFIRLEVVSCRFDLVLKYYLKMSTVFYLQQGRID